jgi:hypothetical protein
MHQSFSPYPTSFYIQVTMPDILQVSCWVLGDDPRSAFIVNIDKSMLVGTLKDEIKAKQPTFKDMAASSLRIWKVGVCHRCASYPYTQSAQGVYYT